MGGLRTSRPSDFKSDPVFNTLLGGNFENVREVHGCRAPRTSDANKSVLSPGRSHEYPHENQA